MYRLSPMTNQYDELIYVPSHTPSWHLCIIACELCWDV